MAVHFYKAIVQDYLAVADDLNTVGIYTTGHSLGGGLASYVSAIYGQTATAFDSMGYLTAVENMHFYATEILETDPQYITISKPIIDLIYDVAAPQDVWDIDHTKVTAYHLQGEVLHPDFARQQPSQEVTFSGAINLVNIPDAPSFIIDPSLRTLYELGAAAGEIVLESVARHDMATLVIRMFADTDEVQRNQWSAAADYIYPVMFDAQFATVLGFKDHASVAGSLQQGGNYSSLLRQTIAYSSLADNEGLIFGDTAVRAFYNDASDFGEAISALSYEHLALTDNLWGVSKILVGYAGRLALNGIERDWDSDVLKGVLAITNNDEYASLNVDLSYNTWVRSIGAEDADYSVLSALQNEFVDSVLSGNPDAIEYRSLYDSLMQLKWGSSYNDQFASITFALDPSKIVNMGGVQDGYSKSLYVANKDDGLDRVEGSVGDDLILTHNGVDVIFGSLGSDIIDGGSDEDLLDYSSLKSTDGIKILWQNDGAIDVEKPNGDVDAVLGVERIYGKDGASNVLELRGSGTLEEVSEGKYEFNGKPLILENISKIIGDSSEQTFNLITFPELGIDGGGGVDTLYIPVGAGSILDQTIGSYSGGVFADKRMIPMDYTNIERIYLDGTVSNIAVSKSPLDGLQFSNTQYMDYSAVGSEMDFQFIADSRLDSPSSYFYLYGYDQNYYAIAEGDSFRHTGAGYSNEGYVDRSSLSNTIIHRYIVGAAHIHGSDHGDTITIRSAHAIPTDIDFVAGYGDDAIDVSGSVGSRYGGSVAITYTKGNDILTGDDRGITKLQMWAAIRPSDVHITDDLITIDGYGSIALSGLEGSELNIEYLGTEKSATIDGSWSDESWNGYDGRDEIFYGFGGNDTLNGNGGQDQLYGGSGNDTLSSLKGANVLEGGLDDDVYYVSKNALTTITDQYGNNALYTTDFNKADMRFAMNAEGNLVIEDTAGNATITISIDSVFGHIEFQDGETITLDDALLQAQGNVATYNTSDGDDYAHSRGGDGEKSIIDLKGGDDWYGASSGDIEDIVYGGDGGDFISTGLGDDTIYGGKGDDHNLYGEEGDDYIDGGEGRDTYILTDYMYNGQSSGHGGHVDLSLGIAYDDGLGGTDTLVSIEGVRGTQYDDLIIGDNENNHLLGEEGNDTLYGMGGDDSFEFESYGFGDSAFVDGGEGADRLYYGLLEDYRIVADLGAGIVSENGRGGQDIIVSIENIVGSALGGDHITGSDESNEIYLAGFYGEGSTALGMGGDDIVYGSYYDDTLSGGDGVDVLLGRDGNDTLIGGAGNDTLEGGAGDDTYIFAAGDGIDIIRDTEGENILVIEGDIALDELVTTRKGNDLILHIASGVTFENYYESEPADNAFTLSFTDGTQIDAKAIEVNNAAPVAQDDAFDLLQNSSVTGNVLSDNGYGEDADPDGDTIEVVAGSFMTEFGGTLQLSEDGSFTYTPEQDFSGFDTVSYSITDGYEGTDTAEVSFFVSSVNTGPEANDDNVQAVEDTAITIDVLANDNDVDGDILNISIEGGPLNGSVVINADQTITYTPDDNYNGDDIFTYGVDDGHGGTDSATVSLSVSAVNDNPVAQNDAVNTQYNQALLLTAAQLIANDSDIENDALEISSVHNAQNGAVVLNSDGSVSFTPDTNFSGVASFEYTLSDGNGGTSTASVNVAVSSPPDNNDVLYGTEGDDNLFGTRENDIIEAKGGDDRVFARSGNDEVHGGSGNDWLFGGNGDDLLYGNDGDDFLFGQRGSNEMSGGAGDDLIAGSSDRDVLSGENGDDLLLGNNGNDVLDGGQGSDRLYGGRGDDLLFFGEGADYLYGGSGRDVFKVIAADAIESATIRDFDAREDVLDISDILTGYDPIADVLSDFVNVEASRSRATVYVDRDGAGTEHGWEQLVQMQVKGASNINADEDQLVHQGILAV